MNRLPEKTEKPEQKTYFESNAMDLLKEAGLNKAKFAEGVGVARQNIQKVFETKNVFTLLKASEILGVPLTTLISGEMKKETCINGFIEIDDTVYPVKSSEQYMNLVEKIEGVVHIPHYVNEGVYDAAVRGFCMMSIREGKSGARMMRYGVKEVFTLSYDAESEKFSLTLCIGNGEIKFKIYDMNKYHAENALSNGSIEELSQNILKDIRVIYENDNDI